MVRLREEVCEQIFDKTYEGPTLWCVSEKKCVCVCVCLGGEVCEQIFDKTCGEPNVRCVSEERCVRILLTRLVKGPLYGVSRRRGVCADFRQDLRRTQFTLYLREDVCEQIFDKVREGPNLCRCWRRGVM